MILELVAKEKGSFSGVEKLPSPFQDRQERGDLAEPWFSDRPGETGERVEKRGLLEG